MPKWGAKMHAKRHAKSKEYLASKNFRPTKYIIGIENVATPILSARIVLE